MCACHGAPEDNSRQGIRMCACWRLHASNIAKRSARKCACVQETSSEMQSLDRIASSNPEGRSVGIVRISAVKYTPCTLVRFIMQ
eukprot:scaffold88261_cov16-Tisochrysis_lutea.AAC.1